MSNLLNDIFENIGESGFQKINKAIKSEKGKDDNLSKDIMSLFLGQVSKNAQDKNESKNIIRVLQNDHKDNIDNIDNILNGSIDKNPSGILKHIFGDKKDAIIKSVSKDKNIEVNNLNSIFEKLAPIFMGSLSKTATKSNMDGDVLSKILKMATDADFKKGGIISLLDFNKNGTIIDEVFSFLKKIFFSK